MTPNPSPDPRQVSVAIAPQDHTVQIPVNPGHHAAFVARAANVVMHGRQAGWAPHEIAAAVDHVRGQYDNGYGVG